MNQEISEDLRGLFASLMNGLASGDCACGRSKTQNIELFAGPIETIPFRERFCSQEKLLQLVIQADADGDLYIVIRLLLEDKLEGELTFTYSGSLIMLLRGVRSAYSLPELSMNALIATFGVFERKPRAIEFLQQQGVDTASFSSSQSIADDLVVLIENCRANDIDIDTADVTAAIRSGELTISEETLSRLQIETPAEEDTRLEREAKVARRVRKTFRKFARHTRPDNEDQIVKGLTTLAIDLDRTGRIDDEQELIATCLYLTALGISSVAELNDVPSAQMAEALEAGGVALDKTKAFVERRFKRNEFLCDTVEGTLRWWDVETSEEEVEDQEPAFAGSEN